MTRVDGALSHISLIVPFQFNRLDYLRMSSQPDLAARGLRPVNFLAPDHFDVGRVGEGVLPALQAWQPAPRVEQSLGLEPGAPGKILRRNVEIHIEVTPRAGRLGRSFILVSATGVGCLVYRVRVLRNSFDAWSSFVHLSQFGLGQKGVELQIGSNGSGLGSLSTRYLQWLGPNPAYEFQLDGDVVPFFCVGLELGWVTHAHAQSTYFGLQRMVPADRPTNKRAELDYPSYFEVSPSTVMLHGPNGGGAVVNLSTSDAYDRDNAPWRVRDDYIVVVVLAFLERHALLGVARDLAAFPSFNLDQELESAIKYVETVTLNALAAIALARGFSAVGDAGLLGAHRRWRKVLDLDELERSLRSTLGDINSLLARIEEQKRREARELAVRASVAETERRESVEVRFATGSLLVAPVLAMLGFLSINSAWMSSDGRLTNRQVATSLVAALVFGTALATLFYWANMRGRREGE